MAVAFSTLLGRVSRAAVQWQYNHPPTARRLPLAMRRGYVSSPSLVSLGTAAPEATPSSLLCPRCFLSPLLPERIRLVLRPAANALRQPHAQADAWHQPRPSVLRPMPCDSLLHPRGGSKQQRPEHPHTARCLPLLQYGIAFSRFQPFFPPCFSSLQAFSSRSSLGNSRHAEKHQPPALSRWAQRPTILLQWAQQPPAYVS